MGAKGAAFQSGPARANRVRLRRATAGQRIFLPLPTPLHYHRRVTRAVFCMIEQVVPATEGEAVRVVIRPNRSLPAIARRRVSVALGVAAVATALLSATRGNVFAPAFAVVEALLVGLALEIAWRGGDRGESITLHSDTLEVRRLDVPNQVARFQAYWVRVELKPGAHPGWPQRLVLTSHGRELEIGHFLADDERSELAKRITALLAQANAPRAHEF